jgi:methylase of polypeptide subunit release factors
MKDQPEDITVNFINDIQTRGKRLVKFLGHRIIINKRVFPVDSPFSFTSKITAKRIPRNAGKVLDIGTGTGVQAILAAKKGASKVIAIDIDLPSLENAEENIKLHKLEKVIELRKSNLFSKIKKSEKFDLIISQLPFADVRYVGPFKHFLFDPGFKLHEELLKKAKDHLELNGQILIPSGDVANEPRLLELIKKEKYAIVKVEEETFQHLNWKLYTLGVQK